jgi:hypothetical protein
VVALLLALAVLPSAALLLRSVDVVDLQVLVDGKLISVGEKDS